MSENQQGISIVTKSHESAPPTTWKIREMVFTPEAEERMSEKVAAGILPRKRPLAEIMKYPAVAGNVRYEVDFQKKLGGGGVADVFEAYDLKLDKVVAIKMLDPKKAHYSDQVRLLELEAKLTDKVFNPHVMRIYDFGFAPAAGHEYEKDAPWVPYMVMEHFDSDEAHLLKKEYDQPYNKVATIMDEIAQTVDLMNRKRIRHKDLKPSNIFIHNERGVVISDFGLSGYPDNSADVLGTPHYMSPEAATGQKITIKSEVFSMATIAYELLTGHLPFGEERKDMPVAVISAIVYDPYAVDNINDAVKDQKVLAEVIKVFDRAFDKDPKKRYRNATAFARAFRKALGQ